MEDAVFIGKSVKAEALALKYANRHGLIAGATGTGKTVTLQILAEAFSEAGTPVFVADVKGDLAGLSRPGATKSGLIERAEAIGYAPYQPKAYPVVFWDLFGEQGHPVRATITEMGPLLLTRLLGLNETQQGVLTLAFKIADDRGLLLIDLKDLRALLVDIGERADELTLQYGNVARASIGSIQRRLLTLESQGAEQFFGEPALALSDLMLTDDEGAGYINILVADKLIQTPQLYATFLLWLMSELFENLPEIGDPDKPKLVFFFDEAHLLFDGAPKALVDKIEQVVRLIRSKGVGVFFVTQNPQDVPDAVSRQLGNRIQHALRAFTPKEQRVIRAAAETFRPNPLFRAESVLTELGIGEALVSTLGPKGVPSMVERTLIRPPHSRLGPITLEERRDTMRSSPVPGKYDEAIDRVSAYEILQADIDARTRAEDAARQAREAEKQAAERRKAEGAARSGGSTPAPRKPPARRASNRQSVGEAAAKSAARTISTTLARELMRGLLGSLKRR